MSQQQLDTGDPKFEVILERSGRSLLTKEYAYTQDFLGATDSFSFTYYSSRPEDLYCLEMQPVELRINDRAQMVGRIDATDSGDDGSAVSCEGRDYISDLVENNVDPKVILKDGMTLKDAILYLCAPNGITTIEEPGERVSKRTGKPFKSVDLRLRLDATMVKDLKPSAGRGTNEVLEELLARFGLTLQPGIRRDTVLIQAPSYEHPSIGSIRRTFGEPNKNLIISAKARRDYSSFPTHALFTGKQGTPAEIGGAKGTGSRWDLSEWLENYPLEMQDILSGAVIQGRREPGDSKSVAVGTLYRLLYFRDDLVGRTKEQLDNAMIRAISDRLKDTLRYTCKLRGHINPATGYNWATDTLVDIDDDMVRVHEQMWCHKATFRNSRGAGPTTDLEFIRPKTFQLFWNEAEGGKGTWKAKEKTIGWLEIPISAQKGGWP